MASEKIKERANRATEKRRKASPKKPGSASVPYRRVTSREVSLGNWRAVYQFTPEGLKKIETNTIHVDHYEYAYGASAGLRFETIWECIDGIKRGLPIRAFDWLRAEMELTTASLASAIDITPRTLSRRKEGGAISAR